MEIEAIVKYKLKKILSDENFIKVTDEDIEYILYSSGNKIVNYCHFGSVSQIPNQAYEIWADMAIDVYKALDSALFAGTTDSKIEGEISSIKVGDTQINYSSSQTVTSSSAGRVVPSSSTIDDILYSYTKQLQNFRSFIKMGKNHDRF